MEPEELVSIVIEFEVGLEEGDEIGLSEGVGVKLDTGLCEGEGLGLGELLGVELGVGLGEGEGLGTGLEVGEGVSAKPFWIAYRAASKTIPLVLSIRVETTRPFSSTPSAYPLEVERTRGSKYETIFTA